MKIFKKVIERVKRKRRNRLIETLLEKAGYTPKYLVKVYHKRYDRALGWIAAYPPASSIKNLCYNWLLSDMNKECYDLEKITLREFEQLLEVINSGGR